MNLYFGSSSVKLLFLYWLYFMGSESECLSLAGSTLWKKTSFAVLSRHLLLLSLLRTSLLWWQLSILCLCGEDLWSTFSKLKSNMVCVYFTSASRQIKVKKSLWNENGEPSDSPTCSIFISDFIWELNVAVKLLVVKTSVITCLHFSANRLSQNHRIVGVGRDSLGKVQWNLENEIMKIAASGFFLKVLLYAPKF